MVISVFFNLAVSKLITDRCKIFLFKCSIFSLYKMLLKQTKLDYLNKWYNSFSKPGRGKYHEIIQCWG